MSGQERLRKIFRIQCHDEIGPASFGAPAEGIVSWVGRDAWQSSGRNKFRILSQQIDYLPDEWTPDAQPSQDLFVFQKNLTAHQPDKRTPSIQSRSSLALGFLAAISVDLSPAIPATRTDVSTTPLGRFLF